MLRFQKVVKVELVESKERWEQLQDEEKVPSSKQKSCTQNAWKDEIGTENQGIQVKWILLQEGFSTLA